MDFWIYAIPLAAIIGGITVAIFAMYFKSKKDIAVAAGAGAGAGATRAAEDGAQAIRQVLARLDSLDARLAAVENKVSRVP